MDEPMQKKVFLYVEDIMAMFSIGRSKAYLMMDRLSRDGVAVKIGQRGAVEYGRLVQYLDENGGIKVKWPSRRKR